MHSEIQIPPLPKSKLGSVVSGCHPLVCSVRARVSEEGSQCPRDVPSPGQGALRAPARPEAQPCSAFRARALEGCVYNTPSSSSS